MKTFQAQVKCRKPHSWTYKQRAESNTLTAHKRNCLLPNPTSMHAPRAPRGILTQNRSTRTATFILLGAHRGLVTLVGEETTQGQHTDLQSMEISARQHTALAQAGPVTRSQRRPQPLLQRLRARYSAGSGLSPRIPYTECVVLAIFWTLEPPLAALLFLTSW